MNKNNVSLSVRTTIEMRLKVKLQSIKENINSSELVVKALELYLSNVKE